MTDLEQKRFNAIVHIVHEYANFVSSAEMVTKGRDIECDLLKSPANTHVSHAFYLNCRKLSDFFQNLPGSGNVMAKHYVPGFRAQLPVCTEWRRPLNKQLAHVTYARDEDPREIDTAQEALYAELKQAWRDFRKGLQGGLYDAEFENQIIKRKQPHPDGRLSEFRFCNLD